VHCIYSRDSNQKKRRREKKRKKRKEKKRKEKKRKEKKRKEKKRKEKRLHKSIHFNFYDAFLCQIGILKLLSVFDSHIKCTVCCE
jgi:sRNA-binding protein